jgi:hypothetical protein
MNRAQYAKAFSNINSVQKVNIMGMLLKCIGIWLLILSHKENLWVLCNDDGPLRISLPTGNLHHPKPIGTDAFAGLSSENDTHYQLKEVALRSYPIFKATAVMEQSTSSEHLGSREGNGTQSNHLFKLLHERLPDIDYDNRPSGIKARKRVMHEPGIVPQEDVGSNIEGHGSSVESTDEDTEQNNFPDKKCVCCLNNTLGIRNGSDDDCKTCCDAMQSGNNTSDSVGNETSAAANQTAQDSSPKNGSSSVKQEETYAAANQTAQDSSPENGSSSVKQEGYNSSSLDNISTPMTPLSINRMQLDATKGSNLLSQSPVLEKGLNATGPVIPVVVTFTVLVVVAYAVYFYKRRSEFWKLTHLRYYGYHKHMDSLLDDVHGI